MKGKQQESARITFGSLALRWVGMLVLVLFIAAKAGMAFTVSQAEGLEFTQACLAQLQDPFYFEFSQDVLAFASFGFLGWAVLWTSAFQSTGKFRPGGEYGTAEWGDANRLRKRFEQQGRKMDTDGSLLEDPNLILSENMRLGIGNLKQTRKNRNVLVVGGSGTRKSTGFVMPNIMQANSSFVVTDPSGELYAGLGGLLEKRGYVVKCLNLVDMSRSHGTNPFHYITRPEHVGTLATAFLENTKDRTKSGGDPFWDEAMRLLLMALIAYLWEFEPKESQNFETLTEMVRSGKLEKDEMNARSQLDETFEEIGAENPDSLAWKNYLLYMSAPPKTRASVIITLAARLGAFNIPAVSRLTRVDELEIDKMGDRRQALFCIIPQAETTYNFLVGLMYSSLFAALYARGEEMERERGCSELEVPVQVLMDEFANVALPDNFEKILATCRKYDISICIILQNMTQIKKLFEKEWESIAGNCDSYLYLGGNEAFTWRYISEALDKETIKMQTGGKSGTSFSESEHVAGRELLTKGEVRGLPDDKCLVLLRGESGVIDNKYDIKKHPSFRHTAMGGAPVFRQEFAKDHDPEAEELEKMQQLNLDTEYPFEEIYEGGLTDHQAWLLQAAAKGRQD